MSVWRPYYPALIRGTRFCVSALREYKKCWELDAMNDCGYEVGLDSWEIRVESWETATYTGWGFRKGEKISGEHWSKVRLFKRFTDRDEANAVWKMLKADKFTVADLMGAGFAKLH